jgi:NRPS condensation-like uncharacterized protein
MSATIPPRLPARTEDVVLHMMGAMCVPQIQGVLHFAGPLDGPRLRRALRLLLDAEPVLGCRFVARWVRPYWQRLPEEALDAAELPREGGDQESFLAEPMLADSGPRIAALWLRAEDGDRVVLTVHHQAADAGGVKELLYRLAGIYRALGDDPEHRPAPRLGSRSLRQVYGPLLPALLPGLLLRMLRDLRTGLWPPRSFTLPMGANMEGLPAFGLLHLDPQRVSALRARVPGATINDLMGAAVLRALVKVGRWDRRRTLRLWGTVDLRRYLPEHRADGLCNLSGFMYQRVGAGLGERYEDTVALLKTVNDRVKGLWPGLGYPVGSWLNTALTPLGLLNLGLPLFRALALRGMPPVLTNMGSIDDGELDFGEPKLDRAWLVVPTSHPPGLIMGLSGFRGGLTVSLGHFASALPRETAKALLEAVDGELS